MTMTEYREYIASAGWQERRRQYLLRSGTGCFRCEMPRWLVGIVYDQDLHVHHLSYANVGNEKDFDLESLCRRCHEIETFGRSELSEPRSATCELCGARHWNPYSDFCAVCKWKKEDRMVACPICKRTRFRALNGGGYLEMCQSCSDLLGGDLSSFLALCESLHPYPPNANFLEMAFAAIKVKVGGESGYVFKN
jgi:hypothetical protein